MVLNAGRRIATWLAARRLRRRLREAPPYALAELPEGVRGRVGGTVRPLDGRVLEAPLSGRRCVYYSILISEDRSNTGHHYELASAQDGVAFLLEADGHRALIDPAHALISAEFDFISTSKAAFDADPRQAALLAAHALIDRDWFWTNSLEYREAILEIDEPITILGEGVREPDPDASPDGMYRDGGRTRMRLTGTARYPLVISDDPRSVRADALQDRRR